MQYSRRSFLESSALGVAAVGTSLGSYSGQKVKSTSKESQQAKTRSPYRIIYNWDGAPHDYSEYPQTLEQFLEKTYAPMKNTQVDAHFWCIGEHVAKWPSQTMEMVGDTENRVYASVRSMRHAEGIRAMFKRGENPYAALVQRGHELGIDVYASIRMNDNHFHGLQPEEMAKTVMNGLTQLRRDHPEWCLGATGAPKWFAASWNFAIPEVREHRLQHIKEVCGLAEWDGIELDWQRHAFHLPMGYGYRLRYTLTDLQRAVRQMTNQLARERGKPFHLAVRVATTMEACRKIGYDLHRWADENLCDIMIAGGGALTDPGIEVEAFRALLQKSGIQFYPGFDSGFWGVHQGLIPEKEWQHAWVRAISKGYWDRGADGMYVFNWHANGQTRRPLLTSIGSKETLKRTDKVYSAIHRHIGGWPFDVGKNGPWEGADLNDRLYGKTPVKLYRTLTSEGPRFHVAVHDQVVAEAKSGALLSAQLHIELEHFSTADQIDVLLDGVMLSKPATRNLAQENRDNPSDVSENSWLVWSLGLKQVDYGPHEVQIRLVKRPPRLRLPLVVRSVEIHLKYGQTHRPSPPIDPST